MQPHFSEQQTRERKWVSFVLFLAALYNVTWGAVAAFAPARMLAWAGLDSPGPIEFWQCIGMFVALYGAGYWFASTDPARYWPFVLIGFAGKLLGPVGALLAIAGGHLPQSFLWINVTNDLAWWVPFAWALWAIRRWDSRIVAGQTGERASLYRRVIGAKFGELMPNVRAFHSATQRSEMTGVFRVTRGNAAIGNWLTDIGSFPRSQEALQVSLIVEPVANAEIWHRGFAGTIVESRQFEAHGFLAERFGPLVLYLQPRVVEGALEIIDVRSTLFGIPLPPFLAPRIFARGTDSGSGVEVLVRISCSPCGLLVEYRGIVAPS